MSTKRTTQGNNYSAVIKSVTTQKKPPVPAPVGKLSKQEFQTLFQQQLAAQNQQLVETITRNVSTALTNQNSNINTLTSNSNSKQPYVSWTHADIMAMLNIRLNPQNIIFLNTKQKANSQGQAAAWRRITEELNDQNIMVTESQVKNKWFNLKKIYAKRIKEENQTGNGSLQDMRDTEDLYSKENDEIFEAIQSKLSTVPSVNPSVGFVHDSTVHVPSIAESLRIDNDSEQHNYSNTVSDIDMENKHNEPPAEVHSDSYSSNNRYHNRGNILLSPRPLSLVDDDQDLLSDSKSEHSRSSPLAKRNLENQSNSHVPKKKPKLDPTTRHNEMRDQIGTINEKQLALEAEKIKTSKDLNTKFIDVIEKTSKEFNGIFRDLVTVMSSANSAPKQN